jgi:hypothetical protein
MVWQAYTLIGLVLFNPLMALKPTVPVPGLVSASDGYY